MKHLVHFKNDNGWRRFRPAALLLAVLVLTACESPLVLDKVVAQNQQPLQRTDLFQAAAANGQALVTVGGFGVIVVSEDQGQSWQRQQLASQPSLIDVTSCPDGSFVALAMEGQVWVSRNNGQDWTENDMDTIEVPQALTCDTEGRLWVVASFSTILSSTDLGASWQMQSFDEDLILTHVQFFNKMDGLVTGEFGALARTRDGGQTWEMTEPVPAEFYPMATLFLDMERGWVAGLNGTVFETTDGGSNWVKQESDTTAPLYRLVQCGTQILAAGDFGTLLEYREPQQEGEDGHWVQSQAGIESRAFLRAAQALPDGSLVLGGGAGVLKVIDPRAGGKT